MKPVAEADCHKPCKRQWAAYEKCKERIKEKGHGSCEPWAFDYWKCVDVCVSRDARGRGRGGARAPLAHRERSRARALAAVPCSPALPLPPQAAPRIFAALK